MDFKFDEAKNFSDNCDSLLTRLESLDATMAGILRDNWGALIAIVQNGQRDSRARNVFNSRVASTLDDLVKKTPGKDAA